MANKTFSDWLASLAQATVAAGDLIPVVQGGVSKKAPAGQAGGLATLDASGKLVQPRRVLQFAEARGSVTVSTTDTPDNYVLPDPRITITAMGNGTIVVHAVVRADGDGAANYGIVAGLAYSNDNWATWTEFTERQAEESTAYGHRNIALIGSFTPVPGLTYSIGIPFGTYQGITLYAVNRVMQVMEVDY